MGYEHLLPLRYKWPRKDDRKEVTAEECGLYEHEAIKLLYDDCERVFSNTWFHRDTKPLWEELHANGIWPTADAESYLEIGVCEAASFCWMAERIFAKPRQQNTELTMVAVDPYKATRQGKQHLFDDYRQRARANITKTLNSFNFEWRAMPDLESKSVCFSVYNSHIRLQYQGSQEALPRMLASGRRFDMIYVDGEHTGSGALRDIVMSFELLNTDGVMVVDDVNRRWHNGRPQVHEALTGFLGGYEKRYELLYWGPKQAVIRKRDV